jgi:two-component system chemotaxis response regulator CheY
MNILLIDDSATMVMSLKNALEMSGYQVETAGDGVQGLAKVKTGYKPALIITDINMPQMNGIEFIRHVRPLLRFTPILVLSTESQIARREEAKKLGATGWLVKPVSSVELLKVIKQVVPGA